MKTKDLLFEIGCEELPSGSVRVLGEALSKGVSEALAGAALPFQAVKFFATPRRLAVLVTSLAEKQPAQKVSRRGPAAAVAMDAAGNPTPALIGFAKSCGVALEALTLQETDKGRWYAWEGEQAGQETVALLPALFQKVLDTLPIAKPMHWGDKVGPFVRPVHWIVFLFGEQVIPATFYGIMAGAETCGHRYHFPKPVVLQAPGAYEKTLQSLKVVADFEQRLQKIQQLTKEAAQQYHAVPVMSEALLEEVAAIVEWPCALIGSFDERFLSLPAEVLITSLQINQKCFALQNLHGKLLPHFIMIANLESSKPSQVVAGNEKVVCARLSDADFFSNQDQKQKLEAFFPLLEKTRLHEQLGSLADQVRRIQQVVLHWAPALKLSEDVVKRALLLSKCDLMTGMVGEFPELQGVMGAYYAANQGETAAVTEAIKAQYLPKAASDELPATVLGSVLSLANRFDTLIGAFGVGLKPTGMKDPYKCRRHALAVARILMQQPFPMGLSDGLQAAFASYGEVKWATPTLVSEVQAFILERLPAYFEAQGISADRVASVCAVQSEDLYDMSARLSALTSAYEQLAPLVGGVKRVSHLLKSIPDTVCAGSVDESLLEAGAENALWAAMQATTSAHAGGVGYDAQLKTLIALRPVIDDFFEAVMVMVDNEALRVNRLRLLKQLKQVLSGVADLSYLQPVT